MNRIYSFANSYSLLFHFLSFWFLARLFPLNSLIASSASWILTATDGLIWRCGASLTIPDCNRLLSSRELYTPARRLGDYQVGKRRI